MDNKLDFRFPPSQQQQQKEKDHDLDAADEDEEEETVYGPAVPPDGGWGWVIMFASFMLNLILDGVCFSFGIFLLEFLEFYQESKGKTAWVGSVLNGMYLSIGKCLIGN